MRFELAPSGMEVLAERLKKPDLVSHNERLYDLGMLPRGHGDATLDPVNEIEGIPSPQDVNNAEGLELPTDRLQGQIGTGNCSVGLNRGRIF